MTEPGVTSFQIVIDCADPARLGAFWAAALGYVEEPPPSGYASWEDFAVEHEIPREQWNDMYALVPPGLDPAVGHAGDGRPRILLMKVPEGKVVKNRLHLDLKASRERGLPAEERWARVLERVAELESAGAKRVEERRDATSHWMVMTDPEGNEFCVH